MKYPTTNVNSTNLALNVRITFLLKQIKFPNFPQVCYTVNESEIVQAANEQIISEEAVFIINQPLSRSHGGCAVKIIVVAQRTFCCSTPFVTPQPRLVATMFTEL